MKDKKVLVIGAGIVGLCSAYFLNKKGYQVTIIDAGDGSTNCSVGNAGFFCPSHVIPLAAPGIITQGLKWMLNEKSPFYVKPKLNLDLISWGLKFKKAATKTKVAQAAPILHALTTRSQSLVEEIIDQEQLNVGYTKSGLLMICQSEKELGHEIEAAEMAQSLRQEVEILNAEEAARLNPGIQINLVGGVYYPNDTMISPHIFLKNFRQKLEQQGVAIQYQTEAFEIHQAKGKITGVEASNGFYTADDYVVATGSGAGSFLRHLNLNLPMQGGKGYSFTLPTPKVMPTTPAILADGKVSMSPMMDGLRFSGTMEIDGFNPAINPKRIEGIIETILRFLPEYSPEDFKDIQPWSGFRPCTPDGLPYLGKSTRYSNLIVAAGHAMLGLTLGPVSGEIVAKSVANEPYDIDLSLLQVHRYE